MKLVSNLIGLLNKINERKKSAETKAMPIVYSSTESKPVTTGEVTNNFVKLNLSKYNDKKQEITFEFLEDDDTTGIYLYKTSSKSRYSKMMYLYNTYYNADKNNSRGGFYALIRRDTTDPMFCWRFNSTKVLKNSELFFQNVNSSDNDSMVTPTNLIKLKLKKLDFTKGEIIFNFIETKPTLTQPKIYIHKTDVTNFNKIKYLYNTYYNADETKSRGAFYASNQNEGKILGLYWVFKNNGRLFFEDEV